MNQVQEGLFAVEEHMPCSPSAITVYHYALPSTLERAECEEAAARILTFSQQLDRWVGVSWLRLVEMMQKDLETAQMREVPDANVPFSGIFMFGPQHVVDGIHELVEKGMLRRVTEGEGKNALDVFFPTPALVSSIMQKQGVAAS